jgi:hypothetical protein
MTTDPRYQNLDDENIYVIDTQSGDVIDGPFARYWEVPLRLVGFESGHATRTGSELKGKALQDPLIRVRLEGDRTTEIVEFTASAVLEHNGLKCTWRDVGQDPTHQHAQVSFAEDYALWSAKRRYGDQAEYRVDVISGLSTFESASADDFTISVYSTGGGCTAYLVTDPAAPGLHALVTDHDAAIPENPETDSIMIGVYPDEDNSETYSLDTFDCGRASLLAWYEKNVGFDPDAVTGAQTPILELIERVASHLILAMRPVHAMALENPAGDPPQDCPQSDSPSP